MEEIKQTPMPTDKTEQGDWSDEQWLAITTRDRTLLVSAAAGAGKTAVLTERVIRSLTEVPTKGEKPLEINRLLVVTFTKAAAKELKERIGEALSEKIKENPTSEHLQRQLRLLPIAQISTIHAFCLTLLHKYANQLGLKPKVRVAEESETDPLSADMMQEVLVDAYEGLVPDVTPHDFRSLIEDLGYTRNVPKLGEALLRIYKKAATTPEGVAILKTYAEAYETESTGEVMLSRWGKELAALVKDAAETFLERSKVAYAKDLSLTKTRQASLDTIYTWLVSYAEGILLRLDNYDELREHILTFTGLESTGKSKLPQNGKGFVLSEEAEEINAIIRDFIFHFKAAEDGNLRNHCFVLSSDAWHAHLAHAHVQTRTIAGLVAEFSKRYRDEMVRRGAVDFNLIERYTYELLHNANHPEIREEIASSFDAVYVDEYQDVSPLQHALFEVIGGNHRFLVGDIKQSIYRFRNADPDIFAKLKRKLPSFEKSKAGGEASIFMSNNYRCDAPVVDFSNLIFDFLFGVAGERIAYDKVADRLVFKKKGEQAERGVAPAEWAFFDMPIKQKSPQEILEEDDEGDPNDDEEVETLDEPRWVAEKIRELIKNGTTHRNKKGEEKKLTYRDIAIILRNKGKEKVAPFVAALADLDIPSVCPEQEDIFLTPEVQLALCMLNTIDNPRRDVYLAGTLCSPLFDFTTDELYLIRKEAAPAACLYEALCSYCKAHPDFEKGSSFLAELDYLRSIAEGVPAWRILDRLYRETPLLAIAGKEEQGGENALKLLYNYARTCEGTSFAGLYGFIHFVNKQIAAKRKFTSPNMTATPNAVQIITMHGSKGLQYPVVFVSRLGGNFNKMDTRSDLIHDNDLGLSAKRLHKDKLSRIDTPMRRLAARHISDLLVEEEMRLLYVALTRAEERLYVTGTVKAISEKKDPKETDPKTSFEAALITAKKIARNPTRRALLSQKNMLSLVLAALVASGKTLAPVSLASPVNEDPNPATPTPDEATQESEAEKAKREAEERKKKEKEDAEAAQRYFEILQERFAFTYAREHLTHLPKKLSVSRLTPSLLDEAEAEQALERAPMDLAELFGESKQELAEKPLRMPKPLSDTQEAAANEKGIATHMFMQFCDFERLAMHGVEAELAYLVDKGFLDQHTASLILLDELKLFLSSHLLEEMRDAREIYRELRFHLRLPAAEFTQNELLKEKLGDETLYVQGVIDAVICHKDGTITLVDYKTDRLSEYELTHRKKAEAKLRARHGGQLKYYTAAIERMFGVKPRAVLLYSLPLGDTIAL